MVAALNPPLSQAADFWGRKWIVVGCMIFGVIGSIIIARARNMATAIAGFVVIGICFGCQSLLHAIVSEVAPRKHRPVAQGTLNAAAGLGAFLGIAMGGALLRNHVASNYRVHFYVLAGVAFISAMGITTCYNPPPREAQVTLTKTEKLKLSAYGVAFRNCWIASACFCVPALIASTMYRDPKAEFTSHIDAPAEEIVVETQVKLEGTLVPDQKPRGEAREIESV
ncbi:hypothetical protein NW755_010132 [Fusarium falciforme]|uniref:Major facilitator superfamily (MFS) profile domain-containing protein n=1 Tax=Fusarium falciforme TaxID=195108 RepID=A0A9W8UW83_9HYPO|nr:hypothetical protein NW755_010132 [Fusarium falciforme]